MDSIEQIFLDSLSASDVLSFFEAINRHSRVISDVEHSGDELDEMRIDLARWLADWIRVEQQGRKQ